MLKIAWNVPYFSSFRLLFLCNFGSHPQYRPFDQCFFRQLEHVILYGTSVVLVYFFLCLHFPHISLQFSLIQP